jgi:hypothetical protein
VNLEENLDYDIKDVFSTRHKVSQKDFETWAQRIITAF